MSKKYQEILKGNKMESYIHKQIEEKFLPKNWLFYEGSELEKEFLIGQGTCTLEEELGSKFDPTLHEFYRRTKDPTLA